MDLGTNSIHKQEGKHDIMLQIQKYCIAKSSLQSALWDYIQSAEEIIGKYQCGFRFNKSTSDYIFNIRQT